MARKSRQPNQGMLAEATATPGEEGWEESAPMPGCQCESNTETINGMFEQISDIHRLLMSDRNQDPASSEASDFEKDQLRSELSEMRSVVEDLQQQNSELASQLATRSVQHSLGDNNARQNETMSWEERKQLMLQQMEEDSFDADAFVASLGQQAASESTTPIQYVQQLQDELDRRNQELDDRSQQIQELQHLLDQQSETRDGGIAIGAAALTEMFDSNELVREERERLQQMQEEWEEKFRQAEIEASLERAKLSRERQELASKMADLEEQLAHARRESRSPSSDENGNSRRWLAKLGLAEGSA